MTMIAITGASGQLGKATIQFLLKRIPPTSITAIVRDPATVQDLKSRGIVIRHADYTDPESLEKAFAGTERALQISTTGVDIQTARRQEYNVVEAMYRSGLRHIVYTSMVKASEGTLFQGTAVHLHTEKCLRESGLPYTFFRNSMYMEVIPYLIGDALETGLIQYPGGDGKISYVSRLNIAEALANVLTEGDHAYQTYDITGPKAYTFDELAGIFKTEKGMDTRYVDTSADQLRRQLTASQLPPPVVDLLVSMAMGIQAGEFSHVDKALEGLLKRKPLTLREFIRNY